ncbi:hypothetical protein FJT64_025713 [Amphibalanus amphitrite]|uniref:Uncharacterized protein n=1 Tax=Amphibalanus amphitrite TaxID=1232801 RepID=A0A6A4WEX8_AMPAM|nr:hypothetical protein FJT64_025713 [Amphibalanus amphitrite]
MKRYTLCSGSNSQTSLCSFSLRISSRMKKPRRSGASSATRSRARWRTSALPRCSGWTAATSTRSRTRWWCRASSSTPSSWRATARVTTTSSRTSSSRSRATRPGSPVVGRGLRTRLDTVLVVQCSADIVPRKVGT